MPPREPSEQPRPTLDERLARIFSVRGSEDAPSGRPLRKTVSRSLGAAYISLVACFIVFMLCFAASHLISRNLSKTSVIARAFFDILPVVVCLAGAIPVAFSLLALGGTLALVHGMLRGCFREMTVFGILLLLILNPLALVLPVGVFIVVTAVPLPILLLPFLLLLYLFLTVFNALKKR